MQNKVSVTFLLLSIIFCICLIISNILAFKLIEIGPFTATTAIFIFPVSYIINDTITEIWGFKKARLLIWCGFGINFLAIFFFQIAIWTSPSPMWEHQEAFETVLGSTPRIALASLIGFLSGSFVNAYIMSKMKLISKGQNFPLRAIISTLFGEMTDSFFFFIICLSFIIPFEEILKMILFQTITKSLYEIIVLPLTNRIVRKIKISEQTDIYDENLNYNILSVKDI